MLDYTPALLGIILDVADTTKMSAAKQALVKFFEHFNNDDRIYFYEPELTEVPRRRGVGLGQMLNHIHKRIRMGLAVKQCVWLLDAEDEADYRKVVVVVTDGIDPLHNYEIRKALFYDKEGEFEFVFLCLDEDTFHRLDLNVHREGAVVNFKRLEVSLSGLYKEMVKIFWPNFEFPPEEEKEKKPVRRRELREFKKPEEEDIKISVSKISLDDFDDLEEEGEEESPPESESQEVLDHLEEEDGGESSKESDSQEV